MIGSFLLVNVGQGFNVLPGDACQTLRINSHPLGKPIHALPRELAKCGDIHESAKGHCDQGDLRVELLSFDQLQEAMAMKRDWMKAVASEQRIFERR